MPSNDSYNDKIGASAACRLHSSSSLHGLGYTHHSLQSIRWDGEDARLLCCLFGAETIAETSSGRCDADMFADLDGMGPIRSNAATSTDRDEDACGNGEGGNEVGSSTVERMIMSADSQGGQHVRLDVQAVITFPRYDEDLRRSQGHETAPACSQHQTTASSSWYLLTFLLPEAVFADRYELARLGDLAYTYAHTLADPAEAEGRGAFEARLLHAAYADSERMVIGQRQCDAECTVPEPLTRAVVLRVHASGEAQRGAAFASIRLSLPVHVRYHAAENSDLNAETKDAGFREVRLPPPLVHQCYFGGQPGVACRLLAAPNSQVVSIRVPIGNLAYLTAISAMTELVVLCTLTLVLCALLRR